MRKARPGSVFVPYETKHGLVTRVRDLPRFVEPNHVMDFLRERTDLSNRLLDWREEFDGESINEYMVGIGETPPNVIPRRS